MKKRPRILGEQHLRQQINQYLDELEQLARDVDAYLQVSDGGLSAGQYHREEMRRQLARVSKASTPKESTG